MTADELQGQITAYATSAYVASMQAASAQLDSAVNSANQLYVKAAAQAGAEAGVIGSEKALRHALNTLASQGVSVSTYTRKDGTVVHTPVDVGVRRMINDELRQRNIQQVRELAQELGRNYVEVSITANCRESHEPWQGQIYSIDPSDDTYPYFDTACNVGDPVDGFGGYNCGHQIHIYRPEIGRTFTDPLEGTGYTTEEVRALTTKQRALENNIRKTKREIECLKAVGLDTTAEQARLRNYQQQLSTLLKENSAVLTSGGSYRTAVNRAQLSLLTQAYDKVKQAQSVLSTEPIVSWQEYITRIKDQYIDQYSSILEMGKAQIRALSEDEIEAIEEYTDYSTQINRYKRSGLSNTDTMNSLDSALSSSSITQDIFVRRDSSYEAIRYLLEQVGEKEATHNPSLLDNLTWTDKAYLSTTINPAGAGDDYTNGFTAYIYAPSGTHGIYIESISEAPEEQEFLFEAGSSFKIRHAEYSTKSNSGLGKQGGSWTIWLEYTKSK